MANWLKGFRNLLNSRNDSANDTDDSVRVVAFDGPPKNEPDLRYDNLKPRPMTDLAVRKMLLPGESIVLADSICVQIRCPFAYQEPASIPDQPGMPGRITSSTRHHSDLPYNTILLVLTDFRLILRNHEITSFALGLVERVQKYVNQEKQFKIGLHLKDSRTFKLKILSEASWHSLYESIERFAFVRAKTHFFAFRHFQADSSFERQYRGWECYDPRREFARMGLKVAPHSDIPSSSPGFQFRFVENREGRLCTTYPELLVVPAAMSWDELQRCAKFRTRSRFPALAFAYEFQSSCFAGLFRSSQTKVGVQNTRCAEDELMLQAIGGLGRLPVQQGCTSLKESLAEQPSEGRSRSEQSLPSSESLNSGEKNKSSSSALANAEGVELSHGAAVAKAESLLDEVEPVEECELVSEIRRSKRKNCVIFDARGQLAAFGNKIAGKGYESEEHYENCKLVFLNIPNIHAVREAYLKARRAVETHERVLGALADSQWYEYIGLILEGTVQISRCLQSGVNVLVHCSDGWDRTAQLCSLAGLCLDPYYRTFAGFAVLVTRDWISFGHQFYLRLGQGVNAPNCEDRSPVFLQFLDCVWQLTEQYPQEFEFTGRYLNELASAAYSHRFGDFLCNSEFEMKAYHLGSRTTSVWSYLASCQAQLKNGYFSPSQRILHPSSAQRHLCLWKQHFLEHQPLPANLYQIYPCQFPEENKSFLFDLVVTERKLLAQRHQELAQQLAQLGWTSPVLPTPNHEPIVLPRQC